MTSWADVIKVKISYEKVVHGIGLVNPHNGSQLLLAAIFCKMVLFWDLFFDSCDTYHSIFVPKCPKSFKRFMI